MKIYLPTYSNKREVAEIETNETRFHKCYNSYEIDATYKGTIYNATHAYKSESGAWAYWNRNIEKMNNEAIDTMQFI